MDENRVFWLGIVCMAIAAILFLVMAFTNLEKHSREVNVYTSLTCQKINGKVVCSE